MKKFLGPYIHACEMKVFTLPHFAKFIPVAERANWLFEKFSSRPGCKVAASDFSNFEQSWQRMQLEAFEFPVLRHMLSKVEGFKKFIRVFESMESDTVKLVFKWMTVRMGAVRKSGTTNTSFSNGVGNLLIHEFLGFHLGLGELVGAFEGDDGLFNYGSGRFPAPADYQALGFSVKLEIHDKPERASFCGIIYHPNDRINITDPIKVLNRIGWLSQYYCRAKSSKLKALLRAKAMSLCVQSPNCPILADCAQWLLRATRSIDARWVFKHKSTSWWDREQYRLVSKQAKFIYDPVVPMDTRELMEEVFGVPVHIQLQYERWFQSQDEITRMPLLHEPSQVHLDYAFNYSRTSRVPDLDCFPIFPDFCSMQELWEVSVPDEDEYANSSSLLKMKRN